MIGTVPDRLEVAIWTIPDCRERPDQDAVFMVREARGLLPERPRCDRQIGRGDQHVVESPNGSESECPKTRERHGR